MQKLWIRPKADICLIFSPQLVPLFIGLAGFYWGFSFSYGESTFRFLLNITAPRPSSKSVAGLPAEASLYLSTYRFLRFKAMNRPARVIIAAEAGSGISATRNPIP